MEHWLEQLLFRWIIVVFFQSVIFITLDWKTIFCTTSDAFFWFCINHVSSLKETLVFTILFIYWPAVCSKWNDGENCIITHSALLQPTELCRPHYLHQNCTIFAAETCKRYRSARVTTQATLRTKCRLETQEVFWLPAREPQHHVTSNNVNTVWIPGGRVPRRTPH